MPQSAVRGSPDTDLRHGTPAFSSAAETTDPATIGTPAPFIQTIKLSGNDKPHRLPLYMGVDNRDATFICVHGASLFQIVYDIEYIVP